jgi:thiamine kinase-like enzyme
MMPISIANVIQRIPEWEGREIRVTELWGGITNQNFRVQIEEESYVVRIPGDDTHYLGIDREREYQCNVAASATGVAPAVTHFLRPELVLVTRFISGQVMSAETMGNEKVIRKAVRSIRLIHDGPSFPGTFSVFRVAEAYRHAAEKHGVALPDKIDWIFERIRDIENLLLTHPQGVVPCHNDFLPANFIDCEDHFKIIDWEYGGMGDRYFDLGNFAVNNRLDEELDAVVLGEYFGQCSEFKTARLKIFKVLSDIREAMWAMVQVGVSKLDVDYQAYGNKHFDRLIRNLGDSRFAGWLEKVRRGE